MSRNFMKLSDGNMDFKKLDLKFQEINFQHF